MGVAENLTKVIIGLLILIALTLLFSSAASAQTDWNSSPYNYKNSPYNYENSPYNYKNSPYNYDNSPYKYNNDRIIRDNQGRAKGYAVPKEDGGANYYDLDGNRYRKLPDNLKRIVAEFDYQNKELESLVRTCIGESEQ